MSALREAAQQALEALCRCTPEQRTASDDLRAALAQEEQDQMLECAYKSACDIVEEQDKKLAELEAVNRELLEALKYHQEQTRPIERTRAAIAKAEGEKT